MGDRYSAVTKHAPACADDMIPTARATESTYYNT